jgi:hypothetical protein
MKNIKCESRNRLGEPMLNMLMFCKLNAMHGLPDEVVDAAVKDYFSKDRKGLYGIVYLYREMTKELNAAEGYEVEEECEDEDEEWYESKW